MGQFLSYSFTVTNTGTDPAHSVVFNETIPTLQAIVLVTNVTATATAGAPAINGGVLTVNLGTLAPGDSQTITITVLPQLAGALALPGSVSAIESDPNTADNTRRYRPRSPTAWPAPTSPSPSALRPARIAWGTRSSTQST